MPKIWAQTLSEMGTDLFQPGTALTDAGTRSQKQGTRFSGFLFFCNGRSERAPLRWRAEAIAGHTMASSFLGRGLCGQQERQNIYFCRLSFICCLSFSIISAGYGRQYDKGRRKPWCNEHGLLVH